MPYLSYESDPYMVTVDGEALLDDETHIPPVPTIRIHSRSMERHKLYKKFHQGSGGCI